MYLKKSILEKFNGMRSLYFIILLMAFGVRAVTAQQQRVVDSLLKIIDKTENDTLRAKQLIILSEHTMFTSPDVAKDYAQEANEIFTQHNNKYGIATSNIALGNYYMQKGEFEKAIGHFETTVSLSDREDPLNKRGLFFANHSLASVAVSMGDYDKALAYVQDNLDLYAKRDTTSTLDIETFRQIGSSFDLVANIHLQKGNYNISLREYLKAANFYKNAGDDVRRADALMGVARIEASLSHYDLSIEYATESFQIYKREDDKLYQIKAARIIANSLIDLEQFEKAEEFYQIGSVLSLEVDNPYELAVCKKGLATIAMLRNEWSKAENALNEALDTFIQSGDKNLQVGVLRDLAFLKLQRQDYVTALTYADKGLLLAKGLGRKADVVSLLNIRSEIYEKMGDTKAALSDFKNLKVVNDSLFSEKNSQQIEEQRILFDTERKEQQLAIQEQEINLLESKKRGALLQRWLLGIGLLAAIIGMYAFYQRLKRQKVEKEKVEQDLNFKSKQLTTQALHLAKKNEVLQELKQQANSIINDEGANAGYKRLINTINFDLQDDASWSLFSQSFEDLYKDFNKIAQQLYPNLTRTDLRYMALIKMNLSSKEIANILNISNDGIKKARGRLRKKMQIPREESLEAIIHTL